MPDDVLKLIPAAYSGCAHDETCRNMAVMEALRVQLAEAESLSEERRIGWVAQSALSAEVTVRLGDVIRERDAGLARERVLREAGNELYAAVSYAVGAGERLDPTFRWPTRLQRITDALKGLGEALAAAPAATPEVKDASS